MTDLPLFSGLSQWRDGYDTLFCDVWGVVHDGMTPFTRAVDALCRFREGGGRVVLVSNAPQPDHQVERHLTGMGVPRHAFDFLVTAGDVTRAMLTTRGVRRAYHLGPDRDLPLFEGLMLDRVAASDAELIVCTGLLNDRVETAETYHDTLSSLQSMDLEMICANSDLVVEVGGRLLPCAGQLAALYESLGGHVVQSGKPWPVIYDMAQTKLSEQFGAPTDKTRILAVGDGLVTDLPGAHGFGVDIVVITTGIHRADLMRDDVMRPEKIHAAIAPFGKTVRAVATGLYW